MTKNKSMVNAIVEVTNDDLVKGNVELKVYNPSLNRTKGATIEMRKMSGFEYTHVELLKCIVTAFLDGFIDGKDVNDIIQNSRKGSLNKSKVTSKPKLFNCDQCNFQTKFGSALKVHKTRIHKVKQILELQCAECNFSAKTQAEIDEHRLTVHKPEQCFTCDICNSVYSSKTLLEEHLLSMHRPTVKRSNEIRTPSSSPPRKKQEVSLLLKILK